VKDNSKLADDIRLFLATYAKRCPDEPTEYSSPDAYELETAATELENFDSISSMPFSEWGSGGYGPYASKVGRLEHERLIAECKECRKREPWSK
jgi:hypothetical protein